MSNPQSRKWKVRPFIQKMLDLEDLHKKEEWQISYIRGVGHEHIGTGELEKKVLTIRALENLRDSTINKQTIIQELLKEIKQL